MKHFFLPLFLIFSIHSFAQNSFPDISGITLEDKQVQLPNDTRGKLTLIGLAFSKKSDEDLRTWFQPAYTTFINPPKSSLIPVDNYDANLVFIAMLKGVANAASGKIVNKMKEGIDASLHPYVMVYEGGIGDYKQTLDFGAKDVPYFYVLDAEGHILYSTSGEYSEEKFEEIIAFFEE